jgi:hypothetical protein
MKIPGVLYSLLVAIAAWAIDYLTNGQGAGIPWAPIAIAAIPVILKIFEVQGEPEPTAMSRSGVSVQPSKTRRLLLG